MLGVTGERQMCFEGWRIHQNRFSHLQSSYDHHLTTSSFLHPTSFRISSTLIPLNSFYIPLPLSTIYSRFGRNLQYQPDQNLSEPNLALLLVLCAYIGRYSHYPPSPHLPGLGGGNAGKIVADIWYEQARTIMVRLVRGKCTLESV